MALPATDNFNRADANPIGGNWTTLSGYSGTRILSNQNKAVASYSSSWWNADSFNNDQYSQGKRTNPTATYGGPAVRATSGGNAYFLFAADGEQYIYKRISGTLYLIGSGFSFALAATDVLKLSAVSTTLEVFKNGVSQGSETDGAISAGAAGVVHTNNNITIIDDWEGGDIGGGGGVLAGDGIATASIVSSSLFAASAAENGVGTWSAVGASLSAAALAGDGVATSALVGASLHAATLAGDGVATVAWVGDSISAGSGTLAGTGVATVSIVSAALFAASASGEGVGTWSAVGASLRAGSVSGTGVATAQFYSTATAGLWVAQQAAGGTWAGQQAAGGTWAGQQAAGGTWVKQGNA